MFQSLTITYIHEDLSNSADAPWLNLEQLYIPEASQSANLADITAMWHMALSGSSPHNYIAQRCPVTIINGVVTVYLGVYVFPSAQDLQYKMSISNGFFGPLTIKPLYREFDLLIPQTDSVTLDFIPEDDITLDWETEAYNEFGEQINKPDITIDKNVVKLSDPCFAVLRLKCTTMAHYYPVYIRVVKAGVVVDTEAEAKKKAACLANCTALYSQDYNLFLQCQRACNTAVTANRPPDRTGFKISNLISTVQATWQGLEKLENKSLSLKIPKCVEHLLEMCDDGTGKNGAINQNPDEGEIITTVYYSTCTGNILDVQWEREEIEPGRRR